MRAYRVQTPAPRFTPGVPLLHAAPTHAFAPAGAVLGLARWPHRPERRRGPIGTAVVLCCVVLCCVVLCCVVLCCVVLCCVVTAVVTRRGFRCTLRLCSRPGAERRRHLRAQEHPHQLRGAGAHTHAAGRAHHLLARRAQGAVGVLSAVQCSAAQGHVFSCLAGGRLRFPARGLAVWSRSGGLVAVWLLGGLSHLLST